jgi:hypothetical protein
MVDQPSGEMPEEEWVEKFAQFGPSYDDILAKADHCARRVKPSIKALQRVGLSRANHSKQKQISQNPRFRDPSFAPLMPRKFSILYEIGLLSNEQFNRAVADGTICPIVTRNEIKNIREDKPAKCRRTHRVRKPFAIVIAPQEMDSEIKQAFREKLIELCDQYGAKLDAPMAPVVSSLSQQELVQSPGSRTGNGLMDIVPLVPAAGPGFNETDSPIRGR